MFCERLDVMTVLVETCKVAESKCHYGPSSHHQLAATVG
jgi:hypothetical protein